MTQLFVIALDGATLDLLTSWMENGELPLLARLFREGAGGKLLSTTPWATPTAFASFATGTNPGKHGVYDFGKLVGHDYTAFIPTNGSDIRGETVWKRLSDAGLSTGAINVPMTYPAAPLDNSYIVAGIPYPTGSPKLCHPPDLLEELRTHGWDLSRNASDDLSGTYADYYAGLIELIQARGEATAWLLREKNPDFLAVHFLETDQAQHRFWQFMAGEPQYEQNGPHTHAILNLYKEVEKAISTMLAATRKDVTVCIMSDHGFGPTRHQVWLNNWLIQNQYLALKLTLGIHLKKLIYKLGLSPAAIREAAPERIKLAILQFFERQKGRALATGLNENSEKVQGKQALDWLTERLALDFYDVDWAHTRAFSTGTTAVGYVWLNLVGRDPQGTVQPGNEYETTRQTIAEKLRQWEPVGEVLLREDVWNGDAVQHAPDLVIRWAQPTTDVRYFQTRISSHHLIKPVPNDYASHRPDGLYLFHGTNVKPNTQQDANILDLAPTYLWLLGQGVPTNMDGKVLTDCFTAETATQPIQYVAPAVQEPPHDGRDQLSESDEAAIMESLRGLGYIE